MTYEIEGGGVRVLADEQLPRAVAREWLAQPPPAPTAEEKIRFVDSALGEIAVKRDASPLQRRAMNQLTHQALRAHRSLRLGRLLIERGAPCAVPLAVVEVRGGDVLLVQPRRPGRDLHQLFEHPDGPYDWRPRRGVLWRAIGETVADLHARGFRQRDLKAPNLLVDWPGEAPCVTILDLDGIRVSRATRKTRLADLSRLAASFRSPAARAAGVTAGDWRLVLEAYLARGGERRGAVDAWLGETLRRADAKAERNHALGRPLT